MNEQLKIGDLVPQFPGQTHIFFWRELQEMEKLGVDITIFSTRLPPTALISHDWSDQAIDKTTYLGRLRMGDLINCFRGLPYRELAKEYRKTGKSLIKDILICAPAARRLVQECNTKGITHVHVHSCGRAALIAAIARLMGGPTYSITLHGPLSDYGSGQSLKWRHASFATIITEKLLTETRKILKSDLPDRLIVQPMGVDTEALQRSDPYSPPAVGETIRLFSCGRLNVVKGHQDLMQAVRILIDRGNQVHLEIAGEDDDGGQGYHQTLRAHLQDLGLNNNIKLLGAIDANTVRQKLLDAHIFVLASWHEPLGVAYMEAMACEVPTIGTNAGGVDELINNGDDGILVEPKSPEILADAVEALIRNPDLAMALSNAGRARIVGKFRSALGAQVLIREISKIYN